VEFDKAQLYSSYTHTCVLTCRYIGLTMFFGVCIFALWILFGLLSPEVYGDPCLAGGLVASASITFIVMFMPKGRQLSAMGRDGLYAQDRLDGGVYGEAGGGGGGGASSTRSTASGGTPSPSFFPLKPQQVLPPLGRSKDYPRERLQTPPPSPRKLGKLFV
jgi:hypothetical protein